MGGKVSIISTQRLAAASSRSRRRMSLKMYNENNTPTNIRSMSCCRRWFFFCQLLEGLSITVAAMFLWLFIWAIYALYFFNSMVALLTPNQLKRYKVELQRDSAVTRGDDTRAVVGKHSSVIHSSLLIASNDKEGNHDDASSTLIHTAIVYVLQIFHHQLLWLKSSMMDVRRRWPWSYLVFRSTF